MRFFVKIPITDGRFIHIRELNNGEYGVLLKYILNDDKNELNECVDIIIKKTLKKEEEFKTLSFLDKILILLAQRSMIISNEITREDAFTGLDVTLDLWDVINEIIEKATGMPRTAEVTIEHLGTLSVTVPSTLFLSEELDYFSESIESITLVGQKHAHNWKSIPQKARDEAESLIGTSGFKAIQEAMLSYDNECLKSIQVESLKNFFHAKSFSLAYTEGNIATFVTTLFKQDYREYMKRQFIFINKVGSTFSHFKEITMSDVSAFIALYNEDIDAQNKANEKPQPQP